MSFHADRLIGKIVGVRNDRLRIAAEYDSRSTGGDEIVVPLTSVSVVWLSSSNESPQAGQLVRKLQSTRRRQDTVILKNGDQIEGTLTVLDDKAVQIETTMGKKETIERARMAAIVLNSDLARARRSKGPYARLVLANGSRLAVASAQSDGLTVHAKLLLGVRIQIPLEEVVALNLYQGRGVYLSDLKPSRYEHVPYLGISWPYRNDLSVAGNPIQLGGSVYDKGLGMHSESRLSYALGGDYRWFEAKVGLDDLTGKQGSVSIQVLADGKPLQLDLDPELTARNSPRFVRLPIDGVKVLTLVVGFGSNGDVQGEVDWADARVIKEK
jgi:hypothetical protein